MSDEDPELEVVAQVVELYLERLRHGERPELATYLERYPHLAEQIREAVAALELIEDHAQSASEANANHPAIPAQPLPDSIGDYDVIREIGRGGMGVVYEAEHRSLRRRVALKVLARLQSLNPSALERFRREAQSAARLHHTNIVPVFEVGEYEGTWFYAMQYIPGQPLDAVLEDLRRLRTPNAQACLPGPAGTPPQSTMLPGGMALTQSDTHRLHYYRSVAHLGIQVARALAYAHRQGIVHRDIKPSNLLLDAAANVWITDFGLAKGEGDDLTHPGDVTGTLRYMAPERFSGDSQAHGDIYSLGTTLYEMLALTPAFDGSDRVQLIQEISQREPVALSRLDPHIPRDLTTIVHKAMNKEAAHRYASADELAADLQRFVNDEPIRARPPGTVERLHRWSRRNPSIALLLLGILATLLVGVTISTWQAVQATRARDAEAQARRRTREAFNTLTDDVLQQLLGKQIQLGEKEKQFLRKVQRFYEESAIEQGDSEQARADRADGLYRLARIREWLGELAEAEQSARAAVAQGRELADAFPRAPAYRLQLALSRNQLGSLLSRRGHKDEARKMHEDALADCQTLAAQTADVPRHRQELAHCHRHLAGLELAEALLFLHADRKVEPHLKAAVIHNDKALALFQELAEHFPGDMAYRHEWAQTLIMRARLPLSINDNDAAIETYRQALKIQVQATTQAKDMVEYQLQEAQLHRFLGTLLDHTNQPNEAEQAFRAALTIHARLAAEYPTVPLFQEELAFTYHNLGRRQFHEDPKEAERYYRESLLLRRRLKDLHPAIPKYRLDLATTCRHLCDLLVNGKRWRDAEPVIREAVAVGQDLLAQAPNDPPGFLEPDRMRLAEVLIHLKQDAQARKLLDELRSTFRARYLAGKGKTTDHNELLFVAKAYEQLGDDTLAVALAEEVTGLNFAPSSAAPGSHYVAACLVARCVVLVKTDQKRQQLYTDKAMKLLHLAVSHGFRDIEALRTNSDLAPLRQRADFQKLLQDLQARPKEK